MSALRKSAFPALLATACAAAVAVYTLPARAGTVEVKFVEPDKFADAGRSSRDREHTMKTLADYLGSLGRELPVEQTLRIEVRDIDLAGAIEPFFRHRFDEVRVLRGSADWPHLTLHYELLAGGQSLKSGDVQLADMNYMYALRDRDRAVGELGHEKRMVRRWFDETFATAR